MEQLTETTQPTHQLGFTINQIAEKLGVHPNTVRQAIKDLHCTSTCTMNLNQHGGRSTAVYSADQANRIGEYVSIGRKSQTAIAEVRKQEALAVQNQQLATLVQQQSEMLVLMENRLTSLEQYQHDNMAMLERILCNTKQQEVVDAHKDLATLWYSSAAILAGSSKAQAMASNAKALTRKLNTLLESPGVANGQVDTFRRFRTAASGFPYCEYRADFLSRFNII